MTTTPRRPHDLSSKKRTLLDALLKEQGVDSVVASQLPRRDTAAAVPLSFGQWRLWFLDKLTPGNAVYNVPTAVRLSGPLNVAVFERSLNATIGRHENLRTTFTSVDGEARATIAPAVSLQVSVIDLTAVPDLEREREALRRANQEARKPFDLAHGPLIRATLWRLDEAEHLFLLMMHHIICEAWSIALLFRELEVFYEAFLDDKSTPPLPQLPIQYGDYATWERQQLNDDVMSRQLAYWKKQLSGHLPTLQLSADGSRPAIQRKNGAIQCRQLPQPLTESLAAFSNREGVTLFVVLLAAYQTLLFRYSGQEDVLVGSPVSSRNRAELEGLIGFFVSTIVLRTDLSGNPTFLELLRRVRRVVLEALTHQDMPFERIVDNLQPDRGASHHPVFQVMFALQNTPMPTLNLKDLLPGRTLGHDQIHTKTSKLDLTMVVEEGPQGLVVWVEYDTDLFNAVTIDRMLGHYQTLLEAVVENAGQRIIELPLLGKRERHQLLVDWNDTYADLPKDCCIHRLFEAQVERTPDAVAVVLNDEPLTYRELNRRANLLAGRLQRLGVGPRVLVAMAMDRSIEVVIAQLACLKAGGAYVPLDPAYPKELLAFMLEDTNAPVLLAQSHLAEALPTEQAQVLYLDPGWGAETPEDIPNPGVDTNAADPAYVMYTSGSTGRPKGVVVPHRAVVRLVINNNYTRFDASRVFLQLAPISFDAATLEVWGALLHGAQCVLFPQSGAPNPEELGKIIKKHGVTTLWLTASLYNAIIDAAPETLTTVRELLTGGEALSVAHIRKGLEFLPDTQLVNGYGPTESTTFTCCYRIPRDLADNLSSIPIGRPIANTQVYILNASMQPVPIGVPGELYIGGAGLAQGYWCRPELTVEKFISDSFSADLHARLYKTGDLVRYLPDGNIEFLGRIDHQVKIRGFRIELGEIEAVLAEYEAVRQCAAAIWQEQGSDKRLTAYFVREHEYNVTATTLRKYLRTKLPEYMVPQYFVELDSMPVTSNGKLDRSALPNPLVSRTIEEAYTAPRTATEALIANTWQKALGVDRVGIHDNFFDLGGHSLLSMQIIADIKRQTGVEPSPLVMLFDTLEQIAEQCENELRRGGSDQGRSSPFAGRIFQKIKETFLRSSE